MSAKLLSVAAARARILAAAGPVAGERVALSDALGRVLAADVVAHRDQPPFNASAMDGWAVAAPAVETARVTLQIVGESAAGRPFSGTMRAGQAVRIFTGAAVPDGCGRVVPQEVASQAGATVTVGPSSAAPTHVRPRGGDFRAGERLLAAGDRLDPWRAVLAAAAGLADVEVAARPVVAVISTGEELAPAGAAAIADHQIYDSSAAPLAGLVRQWGGAVACVDHAGDTAEAIGAAVERAGEAGLIVFIGGASVGDYDLVKPTLAEASGLQLVVESVDMRPGKPTWFGRLDDGRRVLGLPGNPASALVCAELFLGPLLAAWQGASAPDSLSAARLAHGLPTNGPREHWMRARLMTDETGVVRATAFRDQDSSLVSVLAKANGLLRRPANAPEAMAGEVVEVLRLDRL